LTTRQYIKRSLFLGTIGLSVLGWHEIRRQYLLSRSDIVFNEYEMFKSNPTFYHTQHEEVAVGDVNEGKEIAKDDLMYPLRKKLVGKAKGIVLETGIGTAQNF